MKSKRFALVICVCAVVLLGTGVLIGNALFSHSSSRNEPQREASDKMTRLAGDYNALLQVIDQRDDELGKEMDDSLRVSQAQIDLQNQQIAAGDLRGLERTSNANTNQINNDTADFNRRSEELKRLTREAVQLRGQIELNPRFSQLYRYVRFVKHGDAPIYHEITENRPLRYLEAR